MLKKDRAFIYLSAAGIKLFSHNPAHNFNHEFEAGIFEYQEIIDPDKYQSALDLFIKNVPHNDLIILIAKEFTYHKSIPSTLHDQHHQEKESFLTMIPFEESKIAYTHINGSDSSEIIATNKQIYEPLIASARKHNKQILHLIPLSLIHKDENSDITYKALKNLYSKELFSKYDLVAAKKGIPRQPGQYDVQFNHEEEKITQLNPKLIVALFFLIAAFGILIYSVFQSFMPKKAVVLHNTVTKTPTIIPSLTPTPTPTIVYKQFSDLKIQILNGSTISGQAIKLKQELAKFAIKNIATSNYQSTNEKDITMLLSPVVSASNSALLKSNIQTTFPSLRINQSATSSADFDITVVIGNKTELE